MVHLQNVASWMKFVRKAVWRGVAAVYQSLTNFHYSITGIPRGQKRGTGEFERGFISLARKMFVLYQTRPCNGTASIPVKKSGYNDNGEIHIRRQKYPH